jgi:ferric-dicitrate binding protein FerR (iron transport regulator)
MKRGMAVLLVALLGVLAIGVHADADSWVRFVRLKRVLGDVKIDQAKSLGFQSAMCWMPITEGMRLKTLPTGRADVEFEDGSILRLSPQTEVLFSKLMLLSSGERASVIDLSRGAVRVKFRDRGGDHVRVVFAGGQIVLEKSAEFFLELDGTHAKLSVDHGKVQVQQDGQEVLVRKKETREFAWRDQEELATAHASRRGL